MTFYKIFTIKIIDSYGDDADIFQKKLELLCLKYKYKAEIVKIENEQDEA